MIKHIIFLVIILLSSCKVVKPVIITEVSGSTSLSLASFYIEGNKSWSPAFKRAINEAEKSNRKSIFIPSGEYIITQQINLPKDVDLIGESMGNTIIIATKGDYPDAIIRGKGAKVEKMAIRTTRKINAFDRILYVNNTASIKEGDVILLRSHKANSWGSGFEKGEYVKVQGVSKNSIKIFGQVYDDYSTEELEIYRYEGTKSTLKNFTVIGLPTKMLACIRLEGGLENEVSNLKLKGSGYAGLVTILGFNQTFNNIYAEKSEDDKGKGYSYGINIGNSQNVKLSNCNLYGVRHGLTFGGAGTLKIPNRFNKCINSTLSSSINYAASFHPNTEYCSYQSCDILGGVLIRGKSNTIDGCNIFNLVDETLKSNEHAIHFSSSVLDLNHIISNNRILLRKHTDEMLISYQDKNGNNSDGGNITIKDNVFKIVHDSDSNKAQPVINFNFKNNTIQNGLTFVRNQIYADKGINSIQIRSYNNSNLDQLNIEHNQLSLTGIHIEGVNKCFIRNNSINKHLGTGLYFHQKNSREASNEAIFIENNTIYDASGYDIQFIGGDNLTNNVIVKNNILTKNASGNQNSRKQSTSFSNIKVLTMSGNMFGDKENSKQKTKPNVKNVKVFNVKEIP